MLISSSCPTHASLGNGVGHCLLLPLPLRYPPHGSISTCQSAKNEWQAISGSQTQALPTQRLLSPKLKQFVCTVKKKAISTTSQFMNTAKRLVPTSFPIWSVLSFSKCLKLPSARNLMFWLSQKSVLSAAAKWKY